MARLVMKLIKTAVLSVVFGLAATSFAQLKFTPKPGVLEFTGELIVRPLQTSALVQRGWTVSQIRTADTSARTRLAGRTRRYYPEVDEYVVRVPAGSNENLYANELLNTGSYEYVTPNWRCFPVGNPNDLLFGQQWHHPVIKAPQAWSLWTGSSSFTTAFVDTGILKSHVDLKNLLVPGYNSEDGKTEAQGGDINDINGHGTHVSGCGSAEGNNTIGVSGVGWNFRVMHVRCSNSPGGGASFDAILGGARWAADNGAKTISASYSGVDFPEVGTTGTYIKSKGSLFLYAAGNDNRDLSGFRHADTIVVGASAPGDTKAGFSAYGRGVTLFAPGVNILSTTRDGGYGPASGTSMATPVANGGLALTWSVNTGLSPDDVRNIFFSSCDSIGSSSIFGFGRINVFKSVTAAIASNSLGGEVSSVGVHTGNFVGGSVQDVKDSNLFNSYDISSQPVVGVGAVAATTVTYTYPTAAKGVLTSFNATCTADAPGTLPVSIMAFIWNKNTNAYELLGTRGVLPGQNATFDFNVNANLGRYVDASTRSVKMLYRSVVPARLSSGQTNQLRIKHSKPRFTFTQ